MAHLLASLSVPSLSVSGVLWGLTFQGLAYSDPSVLTCVHSLGLSSLGLSSLDLSSSVRSTGIY